MSKVGIIAVAVVAACVMFLLPVITVAASPLGLMVAVDADGNVGTVAINKAILQINQAHDKQIENIKRQYTYDDLYLTIDPLSTWKPVLAIFSVYQTMRQDAPVSVAMLTEENIQMLRQIYMASHVINHNLEVRQVTTTATTVTTMNGAATTTAPPPTAVTTVTTTVATVSSAVSTAAPTTPTNADGETVTDSSSPAIPSTGATQRILHITVTSLPWREIAQMYSFTDEMVDLTEMMMSAYDDFWDALLLEVETEERSRGEQIAAVAYSQLGNVGGQTYWSWYGFPSWVDWCCCFVSWCADQCGYDMEVCPKFAGTGEGIRWFQTNGLWQGGEYVPAPGDYMFIDWECDGVANHVELVYAVDGNSITTVGGNRGDNGGQCIASGFTVGDPRIFGYGTPHYPIRIIR